MELVLSIIALVAGLGGFAAFLLSLGIYKHKIDTLWRFYNLVVDEGLERMVKGGRLVAQSDLKGAKADTFDFIPQALRDPLDMIAENHARSWLGKLGTRIPLLPNPGPSKKGCPRNPNSHDRIRGLILERCDPSTLAEVAAEQNLQASELLGMLTIYVMERADG